MVAVQALCVFSLFVLWAAVSEWMKHWLCLHGCCAWITFGPLKGLGDKVQAARPPPCPPLISLLLLLDKSVLVGVCMCACVFVFLGRMRTEAQRGKPSIDLSQLPSFKHFSEREGEPACVPPYMCVSTLTEPLPALQQLTSCYKWSI